MKGLNNAQFQKKYLIFLQLKAIIDYYYGKKSFINKQLITTIETIEKKRTISQCQKTSLHLIWLSSYSLR